jgi:ATP phosphoribosyltransferase regulatory subunit HisZ
VSHFSDSAPRASASDDFAPPTLEEMRLLWRAYPDPNVRRLLREIAHLRGVLVEVESLRQSIDSAWKQDVGGHLVALYELRIRLQAERERIGIIKG